MTQRIFDIENEKDMADLWDILPDDIVKLTPSKTFDYFYGWFYDSGNTTITILKINWHDKTEITRPIQEATEADIGKLCVFWQDYYADGAYYVCVLEEIGDRNGHRVFRNQKYDKYKHCRRLTKQEIEEIC